MAQCTTNIQGKKFLHTNNKFHKLIFYSLISNFNCRQLFTMALGGYPKLNNNAESFSKTSKNIVDKIY